MCEAYCRCLYALRGDVQEIQRKIATKSYGCVLFSALYCAVYLMQPCCAFEVGGGLHACESSVIHTEDSSFWRLQYQNLSFKGHNEKTNGVYF